MYLSLLDIFNVREHLKITHNIGRFFNNNPQIRLHNQYTCEGIVGVMSSYSLNGDNVNAWPLLPTLGTIVPYCQCILINVTETGLSNVKGELCIGGDGSVISGFLDEGFTSKQFIFDNDENLVMYRTGDIFYFSKRDGYLQWLQKNSSVEPKV